MNQLATINSLREGLNERFKRLVSLLPENITAEKFAATVVTAVSKSSDKQKLLNADRDSLLNAVQESARDGLMIDNKEAALVVFKNQVTYMPMVQGLAKLALNHPEVEKIEAYVVYESDYFSFKPAQDKEPDFQPDWKIPPSKKGEPVLAYAVVTKSSGEKIVRILHAERVMQIASDTRNSAQYNSKSKHFEEWWKKTAIRAVLKFSPRSSQADNVIEHDNQFHEEKDITDNSIDSVDDINADLEGYDASPIEGEVIQNNPEPEPEPNQGQEQGDVF